MAVDPKTISDPAKLRILMNNAERLGHPKLAMECQFRIAELAGRDYDDQLEKEFWIAVAAAEEIATKKNGKTTRLARTRQKEKRVGPIRCLIDWALDPKTSQGFSILLDGGRPDLTGEAIVVRHASKFTNDVVTAATNKLVSHGVDISAFTQPK